MFHPQIPLIEKSPPAWAEYVCLHFDDFLRDHASCERKASALAMSFVTRFSDRKCLVEPMISLAREELEHFMQVYRLMTKRGLIYYTADEKDDYVHSILKQLRTGKDEHFLDRLVLSGLIEARGWERFSLLAETIKDAEYKAFYADLAKREKAHYRIFIKIAEKNFRMEEVEEALERIARYESAAMLQSPISARLH